MHQNPPDSKELSEILLCNQVTIIINKFQIVFLREKGFCLFLVIILVRTLHSRVSFKLLAFIEFQIIIFFKYYHVQY